MTSISVVIPVYNAEKYLKHCIDSIICQLHKRDEVILVDDGSVDDSGSICDKYAEKYPQIRVIHQKNSGVSAARNQGMKKAKGDYIIFADADDYVDPMLFSIVIENIEDDCDFVLFGYVREDSKQSTDMVCCDMTLFFSKKDRDSIIKQCFCGKSDLANVDLRACWGKAFKLSFLRKNEIHFPENVKIGEDMLFMLHVYGSMNKAKYTPKIGYHYYFKNSYSATNRYKPELESMLQEQAMAIQTWIADYPEYKIYYSYYRMADIILYMKFDFYHPQNKERIAILHKRIKRIIRDGSYKCHMNAAKQDNLLKDYSTVKRVAFWCAVHGHYEVLRLIYWLRYHFIGGM